MNCMNAGLVKRLASIVSVQVLEKVIDKKDKLKSKLFMKKLEELFEQSKSTLKRCVACNTLFTREQRSW